MVYKGLSHAVRRLFPARCFLCEAARADNSGVLCPGCIADLPVNATPCRACGLPINFGSTCPACLDRPPRVCPTIAPWRYEYPLNALIRALKYHREIALALTLGRLMATDILKVSTNLPECLVPVPLHPVRRRQRGYNQAACIARAVGGILNLPVETGLVWRQRDTLAQYQLDPAARRGNVRGAFALLGDCRYQAVAIVDDVITTGATVNEIGRVLGRAGVGSIQAWACARAAPAIRYRGSRR